MMQIVSAKKNDGIKRTRSVLNETKKKNTGEDKCCMCGKDKRHLSSRSSSPSSASSCSSTATSCLSRDSDKHRLYPMFTTEYARRFGRSNVPFLRVDCSENTQQPPTLQLLRLRRNSPATQRQDSPRLILYNEYVFISELGKGTYAKVVLCYSLRTGETCALKIFRGEKYYKEACWDEVAALEALCRHVAGDAEQQYQRKIMNHNGSGAENSGGDSCSSSNNNNNNKTYIIASGSSGDGISFHGGNETTFGMLLNSTFPSSADSLGKTARFNVPIAHLPHPIHHAIVFPALGPSLLNILRQIRSNFVKSHGELVYGLQDDSSINNNIQEHCTTHYNVVVDVHYAGMPINLVRSIIYQILLFLRHAHARGIVHTDLKPENVLFETNNTLVTRLHVTRRRYNYASPQSRRGRVGRGGVAGDCGARPVQHANFFQHEVGVSVSEAMVSVPLPVMNSVRVIDLGAAEFLSNCRRVSALDGVTPVFNHRIHTTHYRSVEVVLGLGWTMSTDMWSLGCMIPELLTGDCVFMPRDDLEHLALMKHIIGPFDATANEPQETSVVRRVFEKGRYFKKFFDLHTMRLLWPPQLGSSSSSSSSLASARRESKRREALEKDVCYVRSRPTLQEIMEPFPQLYDLCRRLLDYDPLRRITAAEALEHPFFTSAA